MEEFFPPSTDYARRDDFNVHQRLPLPAEMLGRPPRRFSEVRLNMAQWQRRTNKQQTWATFLSFVDDHSVAWLSGNVYVTTLTWDEQGYAVPEHDVHLVSVFVEPPTEDPEGTVTLEHVYVYAAGSVAHGIVQGHVDQSFRFLFEVLGQSSQEPVSSVRINGEAVRRPPFSSESLALLNKIHGSLEFRCLDFSEAHCRTFAGFDGGDVTFRMCSFGGNARSIFQRIRQNRGPAELRFFACHGNLDAGPFESALSTTTSLKALSLHVTADIHNDIAILRALSQNRSLNLLCYDFRFSSGDHNPHWSVLIQSVREHPTLKSLTLLCARDNVRNLLQSSSDEGKRRRAREILDMLEANPVVCEIHGVFHLFLDSQIFQDDIRPRLQLNKFRGIIKGIVESEPDPSRQRRKIKALLTSEEALDDISCTFLLLREYQDCFILESENYPNNNRSRRRLVGAGKILKLLKCLRCWK